MIAVLEISIPGSVLSLFNIQVSSDDTRLDRDRKLVNDSTHNMLVATIITGPKKVPIDSLSLDKSMQYEYRNLTWDQC